MFWYKFYIHYFGKHNTAFLILFYDFEVIPFLKKSINPCSMHYVYSVYKYDTSNTTDVLSSQAVIHKAKEDEMSKRQMKSKKNFT